MRTGAEDIPCPTRHPHVARVNDPSTQLILRVNLNQSTDRRNDARLFSINLRQRDSAGFAVDFY